MKECINIGAWAACFDEKGFLWLSDFNYGGLYRCDLEKNTIRLEHLFEDVEFGAERLHKLMIIKENRIFLFPIADNYVRVFDIDKKTEKKICMPNNLFDDDKNFISDNGEVWLLSNGYVYNFDFKKEKFIINNLITDVYSELNCNGENNLKLKVYNDIIIIWDNNGKVIYVFDELGRLIEKIKFDNLSGNIMNIYNIKSNYWIVLDNSHDIYCKYNDENDIRKYKSDNNEYLGENKSIPYSNIFYWADSFILTNYYGKNIMKVNKQDMTLESLFVYGNEYSLTKCLDYGACYYTPLEWNGYLYLIPQRANYILKIDKQYKLVKTYPLNVNLNGELSKKIFEHSMKYNFISVEKQYGAVLDDFILYVSDLEENDNEKECD